MYHTAKDITGQRFGHLVVVKDTGKRLRNKIVWECRCDCGNTINLSSQSLLFDKYTSCGCELFFDNRYTERAKRDYIKKYGLFKPEDKWIYEV